MLKCMHHIAIITSSEAGIDFYKALGFDEYDRVDRVYDQVVWMSGFGETLEIFIGGTHPARVTNPEALGLRHLAFETTDIEAERERLMCYNPEPIRERSDGGRMFFVKDLARSIKGTTQVKSSSINAFRHFSKVA